MFAVRLLPEMDSRLKDLAEITGRTKSYYVKEAISRYLEQLEDLYISEKRLENLTLGQDKKLSSKEFWHDLEN